jgi:ribosomal protein L37AE/L43A
MADIRWQPKYDGNVGQDGNTKPDKDEPWRYVCPACETQVSKNANTTFWCPACQESFKRDDLTDLKAQ